MAFSKKTWHDMVAEFPNRRILTDTTSGTTQTVTVTRAVGNVSVDGDMWNATNMNDLEDRIEDAFEDCVSSAYSTTEQEVGTWIDGKTIYKRTFEKTVNVTTGSGVASHTEDLTVTDAKFIINAEGFWTTNDKSYALPISSSLGVSTGTGTIFFLQSNNYHINFAIQFNQTKTFTKLVATVYYLKEA